MHAPKLLLQILELRLRLTICDPHQTAELQKQMDEVQENLCLVAKVSPAMVKIVADSRYPKFVAEQSQNGSLRLSGQKNILIFEEPTQER